MLPGLFLYGAMRLPAAVSKPTVVVFGAALLPIALLLRRAARRDGPPRGSLRLLAGLNGATALAATVGVLVARSQFGRLGAGVVLASAAVLALLAIVEARLPGEQCP